MDLQGIIQIGTVVTAHGVKGEMKILPLTESPDLFFELKTLELIHKSERRTLTLDKARETKNHWLLNFSEISDRTEALSYKGAGIFTEEENLRPLDEDEFYIHDLVNANVFSTDNEYLGKIVNYFEAGSQGVCEVQSEEDSFLFPTSEEVLVEVTPPNRVVINLIPELRDLNKKKSR